MKEQHKRNPLRFDNQHLLCVNEITDWNPVDYFFSLSVGTFIILTFLYRLGKLYQCISER